jgi:2-C-methyl-D-erythritol 4-phosphate cytidylyltransferase
VKRFAIIVAGGKGSRMGADIPKQFLLLDTKPVLMHTIERFLKFDNSIDIILVLPAEQIEYWEDLCEQYNFHAPIRLAKGGETRFGSVYNGLSCITETEGVVAVHDGVRPLVSDDTLDRCFNMAVEKETAVPVVGMVDSVRRVTAHGSEPEDRSLLYMVQTPQVFSLPVLKRAYQQQYAEKFTDDASVVELMGFSINLVEGNRENIKITTPGDLLIARAFIESGF